jgi:hypothetical protein
LRAVVKNPGEKLEPGIIHGKLGAFYGISGQKSIRPRSFSHQKGRLNWTIVYGMIQ